jgi:hypothetical protein
MGRVIRLSSVRTGRIAQWLGIVAVAVVGLVPVPAAAGTPSENLLELAGRSGPSAGLGFGISPLRWDVLAPPDAVVDPPTGGSRILAERDPGSRAVSLDVKLRWPTSELPFEPYLFVGPALVVDQPYDVAAMLGTPTDPRVRLGARAGAGFNWRLTRDATLFGLYDVTTTDDRLGVPGARTPASSSPTTYDLLYGVRIRY